jgi:hypothetical protein
MSHPTGPIHSYAIDDEALASLRTMRRDEATCEVCGESLEGMPASSGLLMWARDDELRFEEPALCASCALAIGVTAMRRFDADEEY